MSSVVKCLSKVYENKPDAVIGGFGEAHITNWGHRGQGHLPDKEGLKDQVALCKDVIWSLIRIGD